MGLNSGKAVFVASFALLLCACGGGGGGGSASPFTTVNTPPPIPTVTIGPLLAIATPTTPLLATGASTPTLSTVNSPPPAHPAPLGTVFPVTEAVLMFSNTSVTDYSGGQGATITLLGNKNPNGGYNTTGSGVAVFLLNVPGLSLGSDANLPTDATVINLANGGTASLTLSALSYTHLGAWLYQPSGGGAAYYGVVTGGYQTPAGSVPTSGSATYAADAGHVIGTIYVPDNSGSITPGGLTGQGSVGVNFASGVVSGSLTSMNAKGPTATGGTVTPWNNVTLTGTLSGATLSGATAAGAPPPTGGNYALSAAATGKFSGALYGPNGEELGAIWTLNEPNSANGKSAVGLIAATKQ